MLRVNPASAVYDGEGNRVSETLGSTTTKFLVDDKNSTGLPQVLDEITNGSVNVRSPTDQGERMTARRLGDPSQDRAPCLVLWVGLPGLP